MINRSKRKKNDKLTKTNSLVFYVLKEEYFKKSYGFIHLSSLYKKHFFSIFHINTFYSAIKTLQAQKYIKIIRDKKSSDKNVKKCIILKEEKDNIVFSQLNEVKAENITLCKRNIYKGKIVSHFPEEAKIILKSALNNDLYSIYLPNKKHPFFYISSNSIVSIEGICIDANEYCSQIIDTNNPEVLSLNI